MSQFQQSPQQGQDQNQSNQNTQTLQKKKSTYKAKQKPIQAKQQRVKSRHQPVQAKQKPIQAKQQPMNKSNGNTQSLPTQMKANMEAMGGVDLSDVKVHRNSSEPQKVGALAYAQGSDIHLGPGQEKHLGHEAWHTVQQKQGRVQPTTLQAKGLPINDDSRLEREADEMSEKVRQCKCANCAGCNKKSSTSQKQSSSQVIQRQKPTAVEKIQETAEYIEEEATELLDGLIPIGQGLSFSMQGGVTWGYPVYTGLGTILYLKRKDADTLHLLVRKKGTVAYDTGVGASMFFGDPNPKPGEKAVGLGGNAGANFQAGVDVTVLEEYEIPLDTFIRLASTKLLASAFEFGAGVLATPITSLLEKDWEKYNTRQSIDFTTYAQLDAEAGLGLRRASNNYNERELINGEKGGLETWGDQDSRPFQESKPKLLEGDPLALVNSLGYFASGQLRGQVNVGLDRTQEGNKTITIFSMDGETTVLQNILPIPLLNSLGAGVGAELIFTQEPGKKTTIKLQLYQKSGEDKVYDGGYNKQMFVIDLTGLYSSLEDFINNLTSQSLNLNFNSSMIEGVSIEHRFLLLNGGLGRLGSLMRRQQGTRSLLADSTKNAAHYSGINYNIYLDLSASMNDVDFKALFEKLKTTQQGVKDATKDSDGIMETFIALKSYLSDEGNQEQLEGLLDEILVKFLVGKALFRLEATIGTGFSAEVAAYAKAHVDASFEGGVFCEIDLVNKIGSEGQVNLRHLVDAVPEIMNNPKEYLSECPLVDVILNAAERGKGKGDGGQNDTGSGNESANKAGGNTDLSSIETVEESQAPSLDRVTPTTSIPEDFIIDDPNPNLQMVAVPGSAEGFETDFILVDYDVVFRVQLQRPVFNEEEVHFLVTEDVYVKHEKVQYVLPKGVTFIFTREYYDSVLYGHTNHQQTPASSQE